MNQQWSSRDRKDMLLRTVELLGKAFGSAIRAGKISLMPAESGRAGALGRESRRERDA